MQVGVGTNATIPATPGPLVLQWARAADDGPFSTLGIIDRIAYPSHEPLVTVAALLGATRRIRATTTVLVAPIRQAALLAKQAATLDALSGGRLTLGLGIGGREEDYRAAGASVAFPRRADALEEQIALMRRVWGGEPPADRVAPVGPPPVTAGGPEVLIGGYSSPAALRAGRLGDGFIAGNLPPHRAASLYAQAVEAWDAAGRGGRPRFVGCGYWALGQEATVARGRDHLRDYYAFAGERAEQIAGSMLASEAQVHQRLDAAAAVGMDEVVLWPAVPDLDQLDRLARLVDSRGG